MPKSSCGLLGCECPNHRAKVRQPARLWTPDMDRTVAEALDRGDHIRAIAARLHVTEDSIRWRAKQLGRSLRDGWYSRQEIGPLLGVGRRSVDRWMRTELLTVTRHGTRWTRVRQSDLLTFVQAHAGVEFDPTGITDPVLHRLADVSATVNRRRAPGPERGPERQTPLSGELRGAGERRNPCLPNSLARTAPSGSSRCR